MTLFDPFADLTRLRQRIDRMVDEAQPAASTHGERSRVWRPAVDVFEDEDGLTLKLDVPDASRESLDVQLTGEELTIRGERKWVQPEKGGAIHSERTHGQFHRAFRLGYPVQADAVQASYKDGVLTVRLPKAEMVKSRKVAVRTEGA